MYSTLVVLASLTSLPAQAGEPELLPHYLPTQRELSRLHWQLKHLEESLVPYFMRVNAQAQRVRRVNGSLLQRVLLLRQSVERADRAAHQAAALRSCWDAEVQRSPAPAAKQFVDTLFATINDSRAGVRFLLYNEILNYRYPWEADPWSGPSLHNRCFEAVASLFGMEDNPVELLYGIGRTEAFLTDLRPFLRW